MTNLLAEGMPSGVDVVRQLSAHEDKALLALSTADAVTDTIAVDLVREVGLHDQPHRFVQLVRSCSFVVDRNHEWRLDDDTKTYLQSQCLLNEELWTAANNWLYEQATRPALDDAVPTYLRDRAAIAYHLAATDPIAGEQQYTELAVAAESETEHETTWLADRLATSQRNLGVLPRESADLAFLSAMNLYCNGPRDQAIRKLRPLTMARDVTMPVAVACHVVGRWDGDGRSDVHPAVAIKMVRRSISIGEALHNPRHVAQAEHTLALLLLMHQRNRSEAEAFNLLDRSLRTLAREKDLFGTAKVLHTYGQALSKRGRGNDRERARNMLIRSLEIGRALDKPRHEAAVLRNLAPLLKQRAPQLADQANEIAHRLDPRPPKAAATSTGPRPPSGKHSR